jgi:hypothetical protein
MDRDTQIVVLKALTHLDIGTPMRNEVLAEIDKLEQYNTEYAENKKAAFPSTIEGHKFDKNCGCPQCEQSW